MVDIEFKIPETIQIEEVDDNILDYYIVNLELFMDLSNLPVARGQVIQFDVDLDQFFNPNDPTVITFLQTPKNYKFLLLDFELLCETLIAHSTFKLTDMTKETLRPNVTKDGSVVIGSTTSRFPGYEINRDPTKIKFRPMVDLLQNFMNIVSTSGTSTTFIIFKVAIVRNDQLGLFKKLLREWNY